MNADLWNRLSDWHNAWLDADVDGRRQLRAQLTATQPELASYADDLVADGSALRGFLETPAFLLAARRMASETMTLPADAEVGPYRIVSLIAHGGMGVVYRATDVRLHRDVALKMLTPLAVPDEPRIERFLREARITAAIDHPNVVKVYDVGLFEGDPYIVVELLEGETLRARLNRGRLPPSEARRITTDIARGLVAAHAAGLVHRDLKPENVFLTRTGATKILDFGIAKLAPDAARPRGAAPTVTGILLGTAGYLAPEQIRGEQVDARADLFAVGSILFELVTGQRPFDGENTVDTLHAILHAPLPDVIQRGDVPDGLAKIAARLLEKMPADRFQSAADLAWALEQSVVAHTAPSRLVGSDSSERWTLTSRRMLFVAVVVLSAIVFAMWRAMGPSAVNPKPGAVTRFTWTLPEGTTLYSAPAVSPDGRRISWAGRNPSGTPQVFVRAMSSLDATAVPGTEGGRHPFWSPDGQAIGFFAKGKLQRVAVDGGPPVVLADAPDPRGGAWSQNGVIVFAPNYRDTPLMRVSDRGGPVEPVTVIDIGQEEVTNRWPAFLPDGIHFLYSVVSLRDERRGIYVGSLDVPPAKSSRRLFASDSGAMYVPLGDGSRGALLSVGNGRIELRPFDPARQLLEGDARTIGVDAIATSPHHAALFGASADVLAYSDVLVPWGARFASIGRDGTDLRIASGPELGGFPRVSPDGGRLARARVDPTRGNPDIWLDDLQRGTQLRLTTSADFDVLPVWSPDGREVAYRSGTLGEPIIGFAAADGTGTTRTLACPQVPCEPSDWSPDGLYLIVTVRSRDIWMVPLERGASPQPLLTEAFTERDARISPDGRWLAYVSDESGRAEVSVRSLVGPARRFVISSGGGDQPVWRRDGAELFFAAGEGRLHSVSVQSDAKNGLSIGTATRLEVPPLGERHWGTNYDVSGDGRRVFFSHAVSERAPRQFGVIMNWSALLK